MSSRSFLHPSWAIGAFFYSLGIADSRRKIDRGYQHKVEETEKRDVLIELCTIHGTFKSR